MIKRDLIHVQVCESLCPSHEDLEALANVFTTAGQDPLGMTVITLSGIECDVKTEDVQEGAEFNLVTVSVKPHETIVAHDVLEIWRVGRIEGCRVFCFDDEELYADVSAEYIDKFALNSDGYYVRYGNGEEGFLVSGVKQ